MITVKQHIAVELIQKFTSAQAWEYLLIPYDMDNDVLLCYGQDGKQYDSICQEIDVLYNIKINVTFVDDGQIQKLLRQYYRVDSREKGNVSLSISEIGSGQGFLMGLIEEAFDNYASDIHVESYEERCRIRLRIDGKLLEKYVIEKINYASLVNQIKILANLDISERRLPQDGRILYNRNGKKFDVRVSSLPTIYGEKIVMRLLTRHIELLELSNLGFSERQLNDYYKVIEKPHGMILICGPTGSGKSTTLYATLRRLNKESGNILTIEDPVEYTLAGVNQVQLKDEIGLTFANALRTFLRQDPDIIMLGEIRDTETAQIAIRSSLTGHLIFSTIHTNSAWGSVTRLIDMGVHPYLIANTLIMCLSQRLIRLLCPHCKQKKDIIGNDIKELLQNSDISYYYEAKGCDRCFYTGYSGRRAIYEVIPVDEELSVAIRNTESDVESLLKSRGIISLKDAGLEMLKTGETSLEELIPLLRN
ncbi:MAG: GspE/PulE family protein [Prevotellaceae bacterium]|jgi:general secretion pathway protein E/type IV pilus assembly protein PilB|nr:GspE/PulE family protein [Prevotellaceae bacterium]